MYSLPRWPIKGHTVNFSLFFLRQLETYPRNPSSDTVVPRYINSNSVAISFSIESAIRYRQVVNRPQSPEKKERKREREREREREKKRSFNKYNILLLSSLFLLRRVGSAVYWFCWIGFIATCGIVAQRHRSGWFKAPKKRTRFEPWNPRASSK